MLGNQIFGSDKFVLFVDHNAYEPISQDLLSKLLCASPVYHVPKLESLRISQASNRIDIDKEVMSIPAKSNIMLCTVSKLQRHYHLPDIIHLVHNLKKCHMTMQLFAWASVKNINDAKIIPFFEHMADIIVTLKDATHLTLLTKRASGSVSRKSYQYNINIELEINIRELKKAPKEMSNEVINPESLATFKINFDEEEQVARSALKLPYERTSTEQQKSAQIHYQPDSDDDIDEEDPDEDLNF